MNGLPKCHTKVPISGGSFKETDVSQEAYVFAQYQPKISKHNAFSYIILTYQLISIL